MENRFEELLKLWPEQVRLVTGKRPVLILSVNGLRPGAQERLKNDMLDIVEKDAGTLSVILSMKQGHVYFRLGREIYDYRPHRGNFSRVARSDYRLPNSDRSEVQLTLSAYELEQFHKYVSNIDKNREQVLGEAHPLQLFEPDFTVRAHETKGTLEDNKFLDQKSIHNCLTWLTTAPLGKNNENLMTLLGMTAEDIEKETHSYIVQFYRFLLKSVPVERTPMVIFWTTQKVEEVQSWIESSDDYLYKFYAPIVKPKIPFLPSRSA